MTPYLKALILKLVAAQNNDQKIPTASIASANTTVNTQTKPNQGQTTSPPQVSAAKPKLDIKPLKFPAMPVEQNDPNLPRLKSQSPTPPAPPQQEPPPPTQSKLKVLGLFFNKMTIFIIIVILFFITSSGLILAYTNYVVFTPPKSIQNLIDKIITISPIPKDSLPNRLKGSF